MDENLTAVYMTQEDSSLFLIFQKHYLFIKMLESMGAFGIKSGSIDIHFDNLGGVGSFDVTEHVTHKHVKVT